MNEISLFFGVFYFLFCFVLVGYEPLTLKKNKIYWGGFLDFG